MHTWPDGQVGFPPADDLNPPPVRQAVPGHVQPPPARLAQRERHAVHPLRDVKHVMTSYTLTLINQGGGGEVGDGI